MKGVTICVIWLAFAAALLLVFGSEWRKFRALAHRGVAAQGIVIRKEPSNHQFVTYSFVVEGLRLQGMDQSGHGTPTFEELAPGDTIKVIYDPKMPSVSALGDARPRYHGAGVFLTLLTLTAPAILTYGVWLVINGRERSGTGGP